MAIRWLARRTPGIKRVVAERDQYREDRVHLRTTLEERDQQIGNLLFLLSEETAQRKRVTADLVEERERRRRYGEFVRQLQAKLEKRKAGGKQAARTLHPTAAAGPPGGGPEGRPASGRPVA